MCGSEIDIVHVIVSKIVSYKRKLPDCIVHGLWCMEERSKKRCSPMYLRGKMKSDRNKVSVSTVLLLGQRVSRCQH